MLDENEMDEAKKMMTDCEAITETSVRIGIPFLKCSKRVNCMTSVAKLNIRYDGNVYPCEAFKNDQPTHILHAKADNVYQKRLKDIYNNSAYLQQIRDMLEKYQTFETCETCMAQYLSSKKTIL